MPIANRVWLPQQTSNIEVSNRFRRVVSCVVDNCNFKKQEYMTRTALWEHCDSEKDPQHQIAAKMLEQTRCYQCVYRGSRPDGQPALFVHEQEEHGQNTMGTLEGFTQLVRRGDLSYNRPLEVTVLQLIAFRLAKEIFEYHNVTNLMAGCHGCPPLKKDQPRWYFLKACYGPNSRDWQDPEWYRPCQDGEFLKHQEREARERTGNGENKQLLKDIHDFQDEYRAGKI